MFQPAENGDFLALDLGGTNFRVLHVRVVEEEQKVLKMDSQICAIPQEMMLGPGEQVTHTALKKKGINWKNKNNFTNKFKRAEFFHLPETKY